MILILSANDDELTRRVLPFIRLPFVIIYSEDEIIGINFEFNHGTNSVNLIFKNQTVNLSKINFVWHRGGYLNFAPFLLVDNIIKQSVYLEIESLKNYIYKLLENKKYLSLPRHEFLNNKIINLTIAEKNGLRVPPYIITTNKNDLYKFFNKNQNRIITKGIYSLFELKNENITLNIGTKRVCQEHFKIIPEFFTPSFYQKEIEKKYEIRSFFFVNKLYSIALFSQENSETTLDFRNYEVFTRIEACQLNKNLVRKICNFMNELDLKIGVIDFIVSTDNKYYFLEVNPCGQAIRISVEGNYDIEMLIANYLNSIN